MTRPPSKREMTALLALSGLLFVAWSLVVPVFESPEEPAHWQYARYVHDHWRLPVYSPDFIEANSPPLYYLAIAPLARSTPLPSMVTATGLRGEMLSLAPPRMFVNDDRDLVRYVPLRLSRLVSAAMAVTTVWLCYLAGVAAARRVETGVLTACLIAFLPQFSFRATGLSNDTLVTLFAAGATLGIVRLVESGFTWRCGLGTATALAAAYLSKINAVALVVPVVFALVASPSGSTRWPKRLAVLGVTLLIVLPWSARNVLLYGDPFALGAMHSAVAPLITPRSLWSWYFVHDFPVGLATSFVGLFGWASLRLPSWAYVLYAGLGVLVVAGLARGILLGTLNRRLVVALLLSCFATLGIVVYINLSFTQAQGRYLFPALPAAALLGALGLGALPRPLKELGRPRTTGTSLAAINLVALAGVVWPAYYPPIARELRPGVRTIQATTASDLAYVAERHVFVVTGRDPWWITPVDVAASDYDTFAVDLRAHAPAARQRGCLRIATGAAMSAPVCFDWVADGDSQHIEIDLKRVPAWLGQVTHVRLDPFDENTEAALGVRVAVDGMRLLKRAAH